MSHLNQNPDDTSTRNRETHSEPPTLANLPDAMQAAQADPDPTLADELADIMADVLLDLEDAVANGALHDQYGGLWYFTTTRLALKEGIEKHRKAADESAHQDPERWDGMS